MDTTTTPLQGRAPATAHPISTRTPWWRRWAGVFAQAWHKARSSADERFLSAANGLEDLEQRLRQLEQARRPPDSWWRGL